MIGAKVGGRMVSLDYQVATGDIVEVITTNQQGHGPSRNWLKLVRTSEARGKIRSWFKKERREENIVEGKLELEREFRRNSISLEDDQMRAFIESIAKRQHCASIDDFFAAIGYGGIVLSKMMPRVRDDYIREYRSLEPDRIEQAIQRAERRRKTRAALLLKGLTTVWSSLQSAATRCRGTISSVL
ncbi:MAG: RelA/SpoT AH/RIS domain-containing protein [Oscillospiraceae bacterium]